MGSTSGRSTSGTARWAPGGTPRSASGGAAVRPLQLRFVLDWNFATHEGLALSDSYFTPAAKVGSASIQIVSGGPDTTWNPPREQYVKMVLSARRTCYLQSPYFIPDVSVMTALRIAALSGVDVRIMIPSEVDLPFVHWASSSNVGELLDAGVRAFGYDAGFLHAKTVTIDDYVTSIGSANWDLRSLKWNFETNAVIYDRKIGEGYRRIFEADMTRSTEDHPEVLRGPFPFDPVQGVDLSARLGRPVADLPELQQVLEESPIVVVISVVLMVIIC